ncbi:MAG: glycosyltransferase [Candidatus Verstraetearchaeota archaeon]|nr:glycosyltransferase [Candidatus Verstraetearchaeota archaeon]
MDVLSRAIGKGYRGLDRFRGMLDNRSIEVLMEEELERHIKQGKKKILYIGTRYDYEKKNMGLSFEHYNFFYTLLNMDLSLIYFVSDRLKQRFGLEKMSKILREAVYYYQPDVLFYCHYHDWISHDVIKEISEELPTKTVIWLSDDHVNYESERAVWELFNLVVTTEKNGYERRIREGFNNVFLSQWGYNHFIYRKLNLPKKYDVCFVGRCYGERENFVETLRKKGINVAAFGQGWREGGRVTQSDLIKIFNQSKIILNISFAWTDERVFCVKGRDFESVGCGSLLLTKDTREIAEYLTSGKEIVTYQDMDDATEKIKYYLANEGEREEIAQRGYERVLREHTYEKRFSDIFEYALKM